MRLRACLIVLVLSCMVGCFKSETPTDEPNHGDGDHGDGDGGDSDNDDDNDDDSGDADSGDADSGDGDNGDGDNGDGDDADGGDGDSGDGDNGDGDNGDGDNGDGDNGDGDDDEPELNTPGYEKATLTEFESYPTSEEECVEFSGCEYAGYFAAFPGEQKSEDWVRENPIAAVHADDFDDYVWKTLRIKYGEKELDVVVYDLCSDEDCDGCCTRNRDKSGFLIDLESHTSQRFGVDADIIEWTCLDCD